MPIYMLNICYNPTAPPSGPSRQQEHAAFEQELRKDGRYAGGAGLFPAPVPPLRMRGGKLMDGPFAESKEALGGFFVVECGDIEEAKGLAARVSVDERSWIEIRQVGIWRPK